MGKNIKILGHTYEVIVDDCHSREDKRAYINFLSHEIHVDRRLQLSAQQECLLHEVLEGINYHLSLNLSHDGQIVPLSEAQYLVFRESGLINIDKMKEYLTEDKNVLG